MSYELVIGIIGFVGVALSWAAVRHFFTKGRSNVRASGEALVGLIFVSVAVLGASIAFNLRTYERLTEKKVIGEAFLTKIDKQHFKADIRISGKSNQSFDIYGDQIRIDARILTWSPRATIFGLDTQYRLERIEGRYQKTKEQNSNRKQAYDLSADDGMNIADVAESNPDWVPFVAARYGNSSYVPMADQARYQIIINVNGIALEAANDVAKDATNAWSNDGK